MLRLIRGADASGDQRSGEVTIAGRYRVEQMVSQRASGWAARATDVKTGAPILLKVFSKDYLAHYRREAAAAMQLNHPHIVRCVDTATDADGTAWIAYPHIGGGSLREGLDGRLWSSRQILDCAADILRGLTHMHSHGWIHCDIKPDNIILDNSEGVALYKLVDLGAATTVREARTGKHAIGSPAYTAPERLFDGFGTQSDLYSVGVVCFEMATGHLPFIGSVKEIYQGHLSGTPAFREIENADLRSLIESLMEKQPSRRLRSTSDALAAVLAMINNETGASAFGGFADSAAIMPAVAGKFHIELSGSFVVARQPKDIVAFGSTPNLGITFEGHTEFFTAEGRPIGPSIVSTGPFVADDERGVVCVVGTEVIRYDVKRATKRVLAEECKNALTLSVTSSCLAWSDARDTNVRRLDGRSSTAFRARSYAVAPRMAFLSSRLLACSSGIANHQVGLYDTGTGAQVMNWPALCGPVAGMTNAGGKLLVASYTLETTNALTLYLLDQN
ncbi:MAG: serine/threonine protein kinase, partial [Burkholderiaceae bacterium]